MATTFARGMLSACLLAAFTAPHAGATTLLQAWQAAQQHDAEFAAARAEHEAGSARRAQGRSLWLPSVMLIATGGKMTSENSMKGAQFSAPGFGQSTGVDFSTSVESGTLGRYTLSARQPLYNRELLAQSRQLKLGADIAVTQWDAARQDLMLRVAERYFDVVLASETVRLLRIQLDSVSRSHTEAKDRFDIGDAPIVDVHEAAARRAAVEAQLMAAETDLQVKGVAFTDLTGIAPDGVCPLATAGEGAQLVPLETWLAEVAQNNPRILVQEKQRAVAKEEAAKHSALAAPSLELVAQVGRDRLRGSGAFGNAENDAENRMIGVQLNVPLFTGGYRSAKHDETLRLLDKADAQSDLARRQVALHARGAWLGIRAGTGRVAALEAALTASLARLDATRTGRSVGDRTTLDLLNAESDATGAELALLQARVNLALDRLRLSALAGRLDERAMQELDRQLK